MSYRETRPEILDNLVQWRKEKFSYREIARRFEKKGYVTIRGSKKWNPGTLKSMHEKIVKGDKMQASTAVTQRSVLPKKNEHLKLSVESLKKAHDGMVQEMDSLRAQLDTEKQKNLSLQTQIEKLRKDLAERPVFKHIYTADNIKGWTIRLEKDGYYRAYKKFSGKQFSLYIGKKRDEAVIKAKIETREQSLMAKGIIPDDRKLFREAYEYLKKENAGYIRIHAIRQYLNWTRHHFDAVLSGLAKDCVVALQGGDPSTMNEDEIRDSYEDEKGRLRITLLWMEQTKIDVQTKNV